MRSGRGAEQPTPSSSFRSRRGIGDIEEAPTRRGCASTLWSPPPDLIRKYCKAHAVLARAHLLFRGGERATWIDHAGDACARF